MESIKLFNGLNGTVVSREDLQTVISIAEKDEQNHIIEKLRAVLEQNEDKSFTIEIVNPATATIPQSMLNGLQFDDINEFDLEGLNKAVSTNEIYQMVTDKIIEALEQPLTNWEREWGDDVEGYALAYNFASKKVYRSVNQIILNPRLLSQKYPILKNPYFLTFKQVSDLGGKVKKDSKGHVVTYYSFLYSCVFADINVDFKTYDREKFIDFVVSNNILVRLGMDLPLGAFIEQSKTAFLKYYKIFNGVDIEGIDFDLDNFDLPGKLEPVQNHHEPIDICEQIIANYPAPKPAFTFGGASAHFAPAKDVINMPNLSQFKYVQAYYTTYFHEIIHSTGVEKRLNRDLSGQMKTKNKDLYAKYAFEELIAEIGAMFLCSQSGILHYTLKNSLAHVKGWRQNLLVILKEDNKFVFRAATQSQKAVDFLLEDFEFVKVSKVKEKTKEPTIQKKVNTIKPKFKIGDTVTLDTFEAKVLSFKANRKNEVVYNCQYVIAPGRGNSTFEAKESDLKFYKTIIAKTAKPTEKEKVSEISKGKKVTKGKRKFIKVEDIVEGKSFLLVNDEIIVVKKVYTEKNNEVLVDIVRGGKTSISEINSLKIFFNNWKAVEIETPKNLEDNPKGFAIKPKSVAVATAIKEVLSLPRFKGVKPLTANLLFTKFRKVDDFEFEDTYVQLASDYEISILQNDSDLHSFETGTERIFLTAKGADLVNTILFRLESLHNQKNNLALFDGLKKPAKLSSPIVPEIVSPGPEIKIVGKIKSINETGKEDSEFYTVNGAVGAFLQQVERKPFESVVITMDGMQGAGKTTTLYKFIDAFASAGNPSLFISGEEHPESYLAIEKRDKYLSTEAKANTAIVGKVDSVAQLYEYVKLYDIIFIDSWQKLVRMIGNIRLDEDLRQKFNGKVFVVIFQQTTTGRTKGGAEVVFDGDIIIKMVKEVSFVENYAYFDKNRYTKIPIENIRYNIANGEVYNPNEPEPVAEPIAKPTYSGSGFAFQV